MQQWLPATPYTSSADRLVRDAAQGRLDAVKSVLDVHPNHVDLRSGGKTSLQVAAHQGHAQVVAYLLLKGAYVNAVDTDGDTTLHYAAFGNQPEVTLLKHKTKILKFVNVLVFRLWISCYVMEQILMRLIKAVVQLCTYQHINNQLIVLRCSYQEEQMLTFKIRMEIRHYMMLLVKKVVKSLIFFVMLQVCPSNIILFIFFLSLIKNVECHFL